MVGPKSSHPELCAEGWTIWALGPRKPQALLIDQGVARRMEECRSSWRPITDCGAASSSTSWPANYNPSMRTTPWRTSPCGARCLPWATRLRSQGAWSARCSPRMKRSSSRTMPSKSCTPWSMPLPWVRDKKPLAKRVSGLRGGSIQRPWGKSNHLGFFAQRRTLRARFWPSDRGSSRPGAVD